MQDGSELRIIVVDDSSTMRKVVTKVLDRLGWKRYVEAENGAQAWDLLGNQGADLLLCDNTMPVMTGLELLRKVRASKRHRSMAFVMITGKINRENVSRAVEDGVDEMLVKPFGFHEFQEKVNIALRAREERLQRV